jgi:hypothetical protein
MPFDEFVGAWKEAYGGEDQKCYLKDFHLGLARPDYNAYKLYDLFEGVHITILDGPV